MVLQYQYFLDLSRITIAQLAVTIKSGVVKLPAQPMKRSIRTKGEALAGWLAGWFPLTLQGSLTLLLALAALTIFAYGAMDLVVFALAICALVVLGFCLCSTLLVGLLLRRTIRHTLSTMPPGHQPVQMEAGYPNNSGFGLAVSPLLPLVSLDWQIIYPACIDTRVEPVAATASEPHGSTMEETIIPRKRCFSNRVIRRFAVYDVLGFCRCCWTETQATPLLALPQTHSIRQLPLLRSLTAGDGIPDPAGGPEGDRMEIRPYSPGDSVKNILWKVFARSRQLNVRLAEKSVLHSTRTLAYFLSSAGDEAAAAVARVALESGALGEDWQFGADGSSDICTDLTTALQALARSRALDEPLPYGLDHFLQQNRQPGAHCIVFAAAEQAPWLAPLKQTIARHRGQFSLVLATDGIQDSASRRWWQRLLLVKPEPAVDTAAGADNAGRIRDLLTEIGQLVESTLIVERKTGASFDRFLRQV